MKIRHIALCVVLLALCATQGVVPASGAETDVVSAAKEGEWTIKCDEEYGFKVDWTASYTVNGYKMTVHALNEFVDAEDAPRMDKYLVTYDQYANADGIPPIADKIWFLVGPTGSVNRALALQNANVSNWHIQGMTINEAASLAEKTVNSHDLIAYHAQIRAEYADIVRTSTCKYGGSFKRGT